LKYDKEELPYSGLSGHSLAGVWIEISYYQITALIINGHSLAGVWIEIGYRKDFGTGAYGSLPCGSVD